MKEKFFELLKISNELKKNKKVLRNENPEAFKLFLKFSIIIEENFHYSERQQYLELANDFLTDKITAENFAICFLNLYEKINHQLSRMKESESSDLANFLYKAEEPGFGLLLASIYGSCDSFSLDSTISLSTEEELVNQAQTLVLRLKEK